MTEFSLIAQNQVAAMHTVWMPVAGSEGRYEVSNLGEVRSVDREIVGANGVLQRRRGRTLKPVPASHGYLTVAIYRPDGRRTETVHDLVCTAFHGPRPDGMEVRHLNGQRLDNRADNLAWGTHSENVADTVTHGTHRQASQKECHRGHLLAKPNLVPSDLKKGRRKCLACSRADSACRWRGIPFDIKIADDYYKEITA